MQKQLTKDHFYAQGLRFSCKRCSVCCRFDAGYVFLSRKDVSALGATLNMEYNEFLEAYCRWGPGENETNRLSLKEKSNNDCIFWSSKRGGGCLVYETRPLQCRLFPFWASVLVSKAAWEGTAQNCPGMEQGELYSRDSIEKMLAMRQMEPIISKSI